MSSQAAQKPFWEIALLFSEEHIKILPQILPQILGSQTLNKQPCCTGHPADTLSASEYESGSRWAREGTAHIDDYSPWTALDVVRVSTRAMIKGADESVLGGGGVA